MKNIALTISYKGLRYLGFQKTKEGPSIEEELEKALLQVLQEKSILQAASRTDKGVNAKAQIINFFTEKDIDLKKLLFALNHFLPEDIRVHSAKEKPLSFHPTLHAKAKEYHYFIFLGPAPLPFYSQCSWLLPFSIDINAMKEASQKLIGFHDFSGFANKKGSKKKETEKEMFEASVIKKSNLLTIKLKADSFLYKMARNIVGTLVYIGRAKMPVAAIDEILTKKDRSLAGITAPANGLFLHKIYY